MGLFDDDVALEGRGRAVFLVYLQEVDIGRAVTQNLEHHDGLGHDLRVIAGRAADDKRIGIADAAGDFDLQLAPLGLARLAAKLPRKREDQVAVYSRMRGRPAHHRNGPEPVELVLQRLPVFPDQELGKRHRPAQGDVHAASLTRVLALPTPPRFLAPREAGQ